MPGILMAFYNLFFPKDNVQTKYYSLHEIPIMSIEKEICYIPESNNSDQKIIFIHAKKLTGNEDLLAKFAQLISKNCNIYFIPQQAQFQNFQTLKQKTPQGLILLGKMIYNGQNQHPLIKYLKFNCQQFYDFQNFGADPITEEVGAFIKTSKNRIQYIGKRKIQDFIAKELKITTSQDNVNIKAPQKQKVK